MVYLRPRHVARDDDPDDHFNQGDEDSVTGPPSGFPTDLPYNSNMPFPSDAPQQWSEYWNGQTSRGPRTTLQTSQSSVSQGSAEQTGPTALPSHTISNSQSQSTSAFAGTVGGQDDDDDLGDEGDGNGGIKIAAGAVPAVLLVIIIVAVVFWMRKRRRQRRMAAIQRVHTEMKARPGAVVAAHYQSNPPSPPPAAQPQLAVPPPQTPPQLNLAPPQPVILGPIGSGSNGAYFTGIDTSDVMSTHNDRTGLGNPFADGDSLAEEPPPPYRPRSMATSRNSSMRIPPSVHSDTGLVANGREPMRSPFADPDEDDAVSVSDVSGPTLGRNHDEDALSVVSDLSYQQEPAAGRPSA